MREVRGREIVAPRRRHRGDLQHVREHLDAERPQELLGDRAAGHPRRGLAGARALEDVADVGEPVLLGADEVRMAGARQVHLGDLGLDRPRVHPLFPVGEVAISDRERDRPAERAAVPDPAGDLGPVGLDLHPSPAPVPELPAREVAIDRVAIEPQTCRESLDHAGEPGAVRLPRGDQLECHPSCARGSAGAPACASRSRWKRPSPPHHGHVTGCGSPPLPEISVPVPRHGVQVLRSSFGSRRPELIGARIARRPHASLRPVPPYR